MKCFSMSFLPSLGGRVRGGIWGPTGETDSRAERGARAPQLQSRAGSAVPGTVHGPTVAVEEGVWKERRQIGPLLCLTPLLSPRRLLLFLAFLQIAILIVVVLKGDILDWVLPPKLAAAFGSRPARSQLF